MTSPTDSTTQVRQSLPRTDVTCYAGRRLEIVVSLDQGDGDPMPALAVASARAQVRSALGDPAALHEWSTEDDTITVVDGAATLVATAAQTSEWAQLWPTTRVGFTSAWWDLEVTDSEGEPWQVTAPALLTVIHEVTR